MFTCYFFEFFIGIFLFNAGNEEINEFRLVADYKEKCYSSNHYIWIWYFILPSSLIFFILIPSLILIKLSRKKNLIIPKLIYIFGHIYYAYKKKYYYWEFIILLKKFVAIMIFIWFYDSIRSKSTMPILIIIMLASFPLLFRKNF